MRRTAHKSMFRVYVHDGAAPKPSSLAVHCADVEAEVDAWVCPSGHVDGNQFRACEGERRSVFHSYDAAVEALVLEAVNLIAASEADRERVTDSKRRFRETLLKSERKHDPKEDALLAYAKKYRVPLGDGIIVFAPPGSGKSTFVASHHQWVDVDMLADELNLHTLHWEQKHTKRAKHYKTIDAWLSVMKRLGFAALGSLFWDYVPDVIVIIDEAVHKKYVSKRDDIEWDDVKEKREFLIQLAKRENVRVVSSFDDIKEGKSCP